MVFDKNVIPKPADARSYSFSDGVWTALLGASAAEAYKKGTTSK
jgi:hypothetical protein